MNELITINGHQLEPKEYSGQRIITFRDIDTVHNRPGGTARKRFNENKERHIEGTDYFVLKADEAMRLFGVAAPNGLIVITESGYLMLIKSFTDDLAWTVQRELVNNYFKTKPAPVSVEDILIYQLQEMKNVKVQMSALGSRVDGIREIVALNPNDWRTEARALIVRIAQSLGGNDFIRDIQREIFMLVNERAGVNLERRLINKRQRMALEGASKSQCNKLTRVDIIADDRKLIEIYIAVVKEMAIKYDAPGVHKEGNDE